MPSIELIWDPVRNTLLSVLNQNLMGLGSGTHISHALEVSLSYAPVEQTLV